jgi:hypothetical protein
VNRNFLSIITASLGVGFTAFLPAAEFGQERLRNFDKRVEDGSRTAAMGAAQNAAASVLKHRIPGVRITWDPIISSPRFIANDTGYLSGPETREEVHPRTLATIGAMNPNQPRDPYGRIKDFLDANAALFGHGSDILAAARVSREYVTEHNGLRTVVWEQQLDGIPVFKAVLYGHITKNGELVSLSSQF